VDIRGHGLGSGEAGVSSVKVDESLSEADEEVGIDEGRVLLDEAARRNLNMTGDEFIAAWDDRRILNPDSLRVQQVAALLPFAR
jgi:hypothetical protein